MMNFSFKRYALALLTTSLTVASPLCMAQDYPSKTITIVVPFSRRRRGHHRTFTV